MKNYIAALSLFALISLPACWNKKAKIEKPTIKTSIDAQTAFDIDEKDSKINSKF